jgi:4-hydroxythreonine-4-phosphate dehydrogenase
MEHLQIPQKKIGPFLMNNVLGIPQVAPQTPRYCIAVGDPRGIGPEVTVKALHHYQSQMSLSGQKPAAEFIVIGHLPTLESTARQMEVTLPEQGVEYIPVSGHVERESGAIAYRALEKSVELIHQDRAQAVVTGPLSKALLWQSGIRFSGQTEILAHLTTQYYQQHFNVDMLFVHHAFRMLLLTRHIPLKQVASALTPERVFLSLNNLVQFLTENQRIIHPKIAVMGLNPHAGELGEEEALILQPGIDMTLNACDGLRTVLEITSPQPADALLRGFDATQPRYDAYVACYHDQGLIPFKLLAGLEGVNVSIGLPFIRTSVSHGMASDIRGLNQASPISILRAIEVAQDLTMPQRDSLAAGVH